MLVDVIKFEIHNFVTHTSEEFLIADTPENQDLVFTYMFPRDENTRKSIRAIQFDRMLDFQFKREMWIPTEFIDMNTWVRLMEAKPHLFASVGESVSFCG